MAEKQLTIFTDGASRGNPGPAAIAYVIQNPGHSDIRCSDTIGHATNNVAEYTAMIRALETAKELGASQVFLNSDSELIVKQLRGEYRVKHPDMLPLYEEARKLVAGIGKVEFRHIPRAMNSEADRLCNEALDGNATEPVIESSHVPKAVRGKLGQSPEHAEVTQFLKLIKEQWSQGKGPGVSEVWEEIASILKRHKLLKTRRTRSSHSD